MSSWRTYCRRHELPRMSKPSSTKPGSVATTAGAWQRMISWRTRSPTAETAALPGVAHHDSAQSGCTWAWAPGVAMAGLVRMGLRSAQNASDRACRGFFLSFCLSAVELGRHGDRDALLAVGAHAMPGQVAEEGAAVGPVSGVVTRQRIPEDAQPVARTLEWSVPMGRNGLFHRGEEVRRQQLAGQQGTEEPAQVSVGGDHRARGIGDARVHPGDVGQRTVRSELL